MTAPLETVIGLEIHVQLATRTKLFCGDIAEFGAPPNTRVCPVCLGLPGALPVLNEAAVRLAVRAALGLGCTLHETSVFARKNYFYADLPKGYQITQHDRPLATGGRVAGGEEGRPVRIRRVHLEEDAGKSLHDRLPGRTGVDLNRAGVPLVEIVTEPDLRGPAEARAFMTGLKRTLEYLEVSDCDMEKGSLRVDANLSVRPAGSTTPGVPTEVKNLNSFAHLERALEREEARQREVVAAGGTIVRETLFWDAGADRLRSMRKKSGAADYRFFPEPDLPPLALPGDLVEAERASLPELPAARAARLVERYGLPAYDADVLTATRALADYYEAVARETTDPKAASNLIMTDVLAWLKERRAEIDAFPVDAARLPGLLRLIEDGTLSTTMARTVLRRMIDTGRAAGDIVEADGLAQVGDARRLREWVDAVVAEHPEEADRYRAGENALLGFFMGRLMERSGGRADPRKASAALRDRLEGGGGGG